LEKRKKRKVCTNNRNKIFVCSVPLGAWAEEDGELAGH
jgi:hypothetical protein